MLPTAVGASAAVVLTTFLRTHLRCRISAFRHVGVAPTLSLRRWCSTRSAVILKRNGGPEVLRNSLVRGLPIPGARQCAAGEVCIATSVAGVNMHDTYVRTGLYLSELPTVMGAEGAGVIYAVGDNVGRSHGFKVGDRVAFFEYHHGYASHSVVPASSCFRIPDGLSDEMATALLVQGFTAHYLSCDTFPLAPGHTALVHAAAGGTGALLTQMAKLKGARVIGTVSSEAKAEEARAAGADEVLVYGESSYEFLEAARRSCPAGVGTRIRASDPTSSPGCHIS